MIEIDGDYYESGEIIALVGCGKQKREDGERYAAKDLYTSSYFSLKRRVAETYADRWYILSAKHGILSPNRRINAYDRTLTDMGADAAREWGAQVAADLQAKSDEFENSPAEVVAVFAGKDYYEPVLDALDDGYPIPVVLPFDGLGLGEQMAYLKQTLRDDPGDQTGISDYTEVGN